MVDAEHLRILHILEHPLPLLLLGLLRMILLLSRLSVWVRMRFTINN